MFCEGCLNKLSNKLNADDVRMLEILLKKNATLPQFSLSIEALTEESAKENMDLSAHLLYSALKKLNILGFCEIQKLYRKYKYYITEDGINVLQLIQENLER